MSLTFIGCSNERLFSGTEDDEVGSGVGDTVQSIRLLSVGAPVFPSKGF